MITAGTITTAEREPNLVCPKIDHEAMKWHYTIAPDDALKRELRLDGIDDRGNVWLTCMKHGCKSSLFIEGPAREREGLGVAL